MKNHKINVLGNIISSVFKSGQEKKLKQFAEILFSEISSEDLSGFKQDFIKHLTSETFEFIKNFKIGSPNVTCLNKIWSSDYSLIIVHDREKPFIIDSITNDLKSRQIEIKQLIHTVAYIERDSKGKFLAFESGGAAESLLIILIKKTESAKELSDIESRIKNVLKCVSYAVEDWRKMSSLMQQIADELRGYSHKQVNETKDEAIAFLDWLVANNFVFLGSIEVSGGKSGFKIKNSSALGINKADIYKTDEVPFEVELFDQDLLFIRKWDHRSVVHRTAHLDVIVVKKLDNSGRCIGATMFFGLFTSTVYYQSVRNIPLMRKKIKNVIERYGYPETSHNCKELVTAIESFPRGELLQMSSDELFETATGIVKLLMIPRIKIFIRRDKQEKFLSLIVFIPEKKFSTETRQLIETIVCKQLNANVSKRYVQIGDASLTRLHLILKLNQGYNSEITSEKLEKEVAKALSEWYDDLNSAISKYYPQKIATNFMQKYSESFDVRYRSKFSGSKAIHDIRYIEETLLNNSVAFDVYVKNSGREKDFVHLKIYSPDNELALSSTLPKIENIGFFAQDLYTYEVKINKNTSEDTRSVFLHHFRLKPKLKNIQITDEHCELVKEAMYQIWSGTVDDDPFNALIVATLKNWRLVNTVRALSKYLKQTKYQFSYEYTLEVLLNNSDITRCLIELFEIKFDPSLNKSEQIIKSKINSIMQALMDIKSLAEDKIIRSFLNIIESMLRTNFYVVDKTLKSRDFLSFKFDSKKINDLPEPKPFREVFVYSTRFEAIHLRGGPVARGGLRWSDRREDFRTEVLGLMKAQMTKNSVIVPVGSKGGFVIKNVSIADGREAFMNEGVECYKNFLRGILDITDNFSSGKIVNPSNVVRYDANDPYLVVAADKGTATFSDYANSVSQEYGFWLDDAFASGGSAGYDHKKMGITAKGGWICVERHFAEMGVDIKKDEFTCVGIGDMSGDVFGNGMLLSDKIKLVAAFNHAHIFIDPSPDASKSFVERKRLFELPRSQWSDYNPKLISKGGGIFDRKLKSIKLTSEMKVLFNTSESELSPDDLIRVILKSPVDLLWNGGIGTYVKAKNETNEKIGDKSNDSLRINGGELRAKVVGEGGNLGFTQLGRIEYAQKGGRINTDFIDNSAGVDCSDHEVNIKITISDQLIKGKIKKADRDKLLEKMTDDVSKLVLQDNFKQSQIITLEQMSKRKRIYAHSWMIKNLESKGELNREIEFLPSDEDIKVRISESGSLTRPEISVLLAYAKNSVLSMINGTDLSKDKYFNRFLISYFPKDFVTKYGSFIEEHKLKKEIISTCVVNDFVNTLGATFFHEVLDETGESIENILKAYVIVKEVCGIEPLWNRVEKIPASVPFDLKLELFSIIQSIIERNISWLIANETNLSDVEACIKKYSNTTKQLLSKSSKILTSEQKTHIDNFMSHYDQFKEVKDLAHEIALLRAFKASFDISLIVTQSKKDVEVVAKTFSKVGEVLSFNWLIMQARSFAPRQFFQIFAIRSLVTEMQRIHMEITSIELKSAKKMENKLQFAENNKAKLSSFMSYIDEIKSGDVADAYVSKLTIAIKKIRDII